MTIAKETKTKCILERKKTLETEKRMGKMDDN